MSIQSEINRMSAAKTSIREILEENEVAVPASATLDSYPALVNTALQNARRLASGTTPGTVRVSDTPDAGQTAADGWAASPAAVDTVRSTAAGLATRTESLESRVKSMNFMKPWDAATEQFLGEMGHGGAAADVTWERASDGADYLVFTVQGTRVCAIRGFCGFNII